MMMFKKTPTLWILATLVVFMVSCKPMPIRTCKYVENETQITQLRKALPFSYYHADSHIRYDIYNSATHLYIRFDVDDELSIRKFFNFGLEIYIDTLAKRKRNEGFIYPTANAWIQDTETAEKIELMLIETGELNELQRRLNPMVTLIHKNLEENTNLFSKDSPISIKVSFDKEGRFLYETAIPLAEFGLDKLEPQQNFTIGILSGAIPKIENEQNQNNNQPYNNNSSYGNYPYNGVYNNNNYQPGYTGRPGQVQPMQSNYKKEFEPINIWIKTHLTPQSATD